MKLRKLKRRTDRQTAVFLWGRVPMYGQWEPLVPIHTRRRPRYWGPLVVYMVRRFRKVTPSS